MDRTEFVRHLQALKDACDQVQPFEHRRAPRSDNLCDYLSWLWNKSRFRNARAAMTASLSTLDQAAKQVRDDIGLLRQSRRRSPTESR
jgi:hypothetical protein